MAGEEALERQLCAIIIKAKQLVPSSRVLLKHDSPGFSRTLSKGSVC